MIDFILVALVILMLLIIKSHYATITAIYFTFLTICNLFYMPHTDELTYAFTIVIPLICSICSIWVWNREYTLHHQKLFFISMVLFAFCAVNAFCATDALSMFIYMETSMIPMALMMLSENKCRHANTIYQYLIYTFTSACLLLVAIIQINIDVKSYSFSPTKDWCYWLIALATAIKLPTFPFHYWVATVHGKSPTICSVMLASVCLKYSSLIVIRFLLPVPSFIPYIIFASMISAICSQCKQTNLKIIFAYSSIIHMNIYLFIPLVTQNSLWFTFSLVAHSITMVLVFLVADTIRSRQVISNKAWIFALISSLCITSIPGSINFIAEICSVYYSNIANSLFATTMIVFVIISSCCQMNYVFKMKENISNYELCRLSKPQVIALSITLLLIIIGGVVPFFKFP